MLGAVAVEVALALLAEVAEVALLAEGEAALRTDLAADLAVRVRVGVDVRVGRAGPDRGDQLVDLTGRDALVGGSDHVARDDRPGHLAGRRAGRLAAAAAQEGRHAAFHAELAEVDVRELHRRGEARVAQLVVDLAAVDPGLEAAGRGRRDGWHLLVAVEMRLQPVLPAASP